MTRCHCEFIGDLSSKAHRDHHREWERQRPEPTEHDTRLELHLATQSAWRVRYELGHLRAVVGLMLDGRDGDARELLEQEADPVAQAILVGQRKEMRR